MFDTKPGAGQDFAFLSPADKQVSWHSVEFLHSTGRTRWKGWYCSAGLHSLYVDFDGNLFIGTCEVGGWYGNVFKGPHSDPEAKRWLIKDWKKCTVESCQCGSDMYAPKVRSPDLIPKDMSAFFAWANATQPKRVDVVKEPEAIISGASRDFKLVVWDLGRRCNYDCSYCFPEAHNGFEAHKSLGSLKQAVDFLRVFWKDGWRMKWVITGGEPTVNPNYLDLMRYIKTQVRYATPVNGDEWMPPDAIHTTTNGSRDPKFYSELIRLSDIGFSGHLEYLKDAESSVRFVANLRACAEVKRAEEGAAMNWLGVRVMLKPGLIDVARGLRDRLAEIPGFGEQFTFAVDLLHEKADKRQLLPYSDAEAAFAANPFA